MKKNVKIPFYLPALILFLVVVAAIYFQPKPIDWSYSFRKYDRKPFGTKALFSLLPNYFKNAEIVTIDTPLEEMNDWCENKSLYLSIGTTQIAHNKKELVKLLDITNTGGDVFLSTYRFNEDLLDTLDIEILASNFDYYKTIECNFTDPKIKASVNYKSHPSHSSAVYFSKIPNNAIVLVRDLNNNPLTIALPWGKGNLILNTTPLFFTNYHLFNNNDIDFVEKTFSYLETPRTVYWDEYFKKENDKGTTPLKVLLSHKGFKLSWYLLLALIVVFILFMSKRKRKAIAVIPPLKNTSLEFIETVGLLYYNQKNHANLAAKIANLFLEGIRMNYHLLTDELNEDFTEALSQKSMYPYDKTKDLVYILNKAKSGQIQTDQSLKSLYNQIEEFKKSIQ